MRISFKTAILALLIFTVAFFSGEQWQFYHTYFPTQEFTFMVRDASLIFKDYFGHL